MKLFSMKLDSIRRELIKKIQTSSGRIGDNPQPEKVLTIHQSRTKESTERKVLKNVRVKTA